MMFSGLLAFLAINTYYHQVLKVQNDEKNMLIAKNMASFIEQYDEISIDEYFKSQANVGYKLFVVDEHGHEAFYGETFRENNLSIDAIHDVLMVRRITGWQIYQMKHLLQDSFQMS